MNSLPPPIFRFYKISICLSSSFRLVCIPTGGWAAATLAGKITGSGPSVWNVSLTLSGTLIQTNRTIWLRPGPHTALLGKINQTRLLKLTDGFLLTDLYIIHGICCRWRSFFADKISYWVLGRYLVMC